VAELHVLPTLWFGNDWASWVARPSEKPRLRQIKGPAGTSAIAPAHPVLDEYFLYCEGEAPLLFTEKETNNERLFPEFPSASPYVKDGINTYVVHGQRGAVNPDKTGTKVSAHHQVNVQAGETAVIRLRLTNSPLKRQDKPFGKTFDEILTTRLREADEFYQSVTPPSVSADAAQVMGQALAGML
jgi:hypothetical protein